MKKNSMSKRILALLLCIVLALGASVSALAEELEMEVEELVVVEEVVEEVAEAAEEPTQEPAEEPVQEPEQEPEQEPIEEPAPEPIQEPEPEADPFLEYQDGTVKVNAKGAVPENTILSVTSIHKVEITETMTAEEKAEAEQANAQYDFVVQKLNEKSLKETGYEIAGFLAYDICFLDEAANEVEPVDEVQISVDFTNAQTPEGISAEDAGKYGMSLFHLEENELGQTEATDVLNAEIISAETSDVEVKGAEFASDSFSVFVIAWTECGKQLEGTIVDQNGEAIQGLDFQTIALDNAGSVVDLSTLEEVVDAEGKAYGISRAYFKDVNGNEAAVQRLRYDAVTETVQYSSTADQEDWMIFDAENTSFYVAYEKIIFTTMNEIEEEIIVEVVDEEVPLTNVYLDASGQDLDIVSSDIQIKTVIMDGETEVTDSEDEFDYTLTVETEDETSAYEGDYYLIDRESGEYYYLDEEAALQKSEDEKVFGQAAKDGLIENVKANQILMVRGIGEESELHVKAENVSETYESEPTITLAEDSRDVTVTYHVKTAYRFEIFNRSNTGAELMIGGSEFKLFSATEASVIYYGKSMDGTGLIQWYTDEAMTEAFDLADLADDTYYLIETKGGEGYVTSAETWKVVIKAGEMPAVYAGLAGDETIDETSSIIGEDNLSEPFEDENGVKNVTISLYFENGITFTLPESGCEGILGYTFAGMILMMAGVLILYKERYKLLCK